ncbi:hypothetical protein BSI_17180 [Bacillus inaquosorum KCTC 13429]|uniref:Uncharacterized protein n=1 Tax=Bacillus inaquosorum KCTC 13429 TaxID=1236548 RepID=A0A9W5LIK1_9BACI|nr:hypothetical protein BSI_17180 [Bacillus inaquosorum KCTC 13429]
MFLDGLKACLFALFVLSQIQLTHAEPKIKVFNQDFTRYFFMKSKHSASFGQIKSCIQ